MKSYTIEINVEKLKARISQIIADILLIIAVVGTLALVASVAFHFGKNYAINGVQNINKTNSGYTVDYNGEIHEYEMKG